MPPRPRSCRQTVLLLTLCLLLIATTAPAEEGMAFVLAPLLKPACDRHIPGYQAETAATYAAWRDQHRIRLEGITQSESFRSQQASAQKQLLEVPAPSQREELERLCSELADVFQSAAPADARFASPEQTWALFHAALRNADRPTALNCLISRAKRKLAPAFATMSDAEMRQLADTVTGFRLTTGSGDSREGEVVMPEGVASPVIFALNGPNWKIADM